MTKHSAGLASIVLALGITAFAGSALAADDNGNGSGKHDAGSTPTVSATHGNSATAPGQLKQEETATHGGADANANAAQPGVKPNSATAHGNHSTSCQTGGGTDASATCASTGSDAATAQTAAHSDASKRYGSGSTAAQIANGYGAPAGTTLYGPGNSQPHKVTDCKHKHAVDVHAVKSYSTAACVSASSTAKATAGTTGSASHTSSPSQSATLTPSNVSGTSSSGAQGQQGGVLGATASAGKAGTQGGVLGAVAAVSGGVLPFTGFPLWVAVVAALALVALGLTLRHQARLTA